jgi:IMP cyclohydrolase
MWCLCACTIPYIVVGRASLHCIAIVDTLTDTLTVQNGPGITDAREQFELGYPLRGALEPNSRGSVISNVQHSMPLP